MKYWEIIADRLSKAGWSWGCVSTINSKGKRIFIADAHRDDGRRFIHEEANSMADEIDPRQPFLRVDILRWREIFWVIETSSSNVDLIGAFVVLIGQRRSTATAKRPPRSGLRPILAWRSFHELELRTFYYDPSYRLSPGGPPAVSTMTIRPNTDLGRRAETHLATITATGNFILFHASHCKLGTPDRNRDNLLAGEYR